MPMLTRSEYAENFEQWCVDCVRIYDKVTGASVPFRLNAPQRRVARIMESQRRAGKPVRIIMLKARQWGGSTLTQIYMAWMQLVRHTGWNSLICSHVKDASANIRGIYSHLLRNYPEDLRGSVADPKKWVFTPFEKSANIGFIPARDCRVAVTSAYAPDAVRGASFQMAHLSEVAFWGDGDSEAAERIVRTVGGSVPLERDTVVVMESTADGTDNFFHAEWQRAVKGESDKTPVFVPWHEIEIYTLPLSEEEKREWPSRFDDYELGLLHKTGLPVEKVAWYHCKRREYATHEQMMAEYPSTPAEAFARVHTPWMSPSESVLLSVDPRLDAGKPALAVMIVEPSGENTTIAMIHTTADGVSGIPRPPVSFTGSLGRALDCLREMACKARVECIVALSPGCGVSQKWLERRVARMALPCSADASENLTLLFTPDYVTQARNSWDEMLARGAWAEPDEATCRRLRSLQDTRLPRDSGLLLRLAAAYTLAERNNAALLSPLDFY